MLLKVAKAAAVLLELRLMPFRLGVVVVTATAGQGVGGAGGLRWPRPPPASAGYGCIRLYWDYIMLKIKRVGRWGQRGCTHTQGDACVSAGRSGGHPWNACVPGFALPASPDPTKLGF